MPLRQPPASSLPRAVSIGLLLVVTLECAPAASSEPRTGTGPEASPARGAETPPDPGYLDRSRSPAERLAALREAARAGAAISGDKATSLVRLLDAREPPALQEEAISVIAAGNVPALPEAALARWERLTPRVRAAVVAEVLSRPRWAAAFLSRIREGELAISDIPARALYRLRNHPDATVASAARATIDPLLTEPSAAIELRVRELSEAVGDGPGDATRGKRVFEEKCSLCHSFRSTGTDLGPDLSAIGLLGSASLLREIIAPNLAVGGEFVSYLAVGKDGAQRTGMIRSENAENIVLRGQESISVIPRNELLSLTSQRVSLMPEGLEEDLSEGELRDLVALLVGEEESFVSLDLRLAANADSSRGLFTSVAESSESIPLREFGRVDADGVPYHVILPANNGGRNVLVLRGGPDDDSVLARSYPLYAELECGVRAAAIHILGAVGGWAYPETMDDVPVLEITLHYDTGETQEIVWRNGREIASLRRGRAVPGSRPAFRLGRRQVRQVRVPTAHRSRLLRVGFSSTGGPVAPLVLAVTVERAKPAGRRER